jgi:hypothetical protein
MLWPTWLVIDNGECGRLELRSCPGDANSIFAKRGVALKSRPLFALALSKGDAETSVGISGDDDLLGRVDCLDVEEDGGCVEVVEADLSAGVAMRDGASGGDGRPCMTFISNLLVRTAAT